MRKLLLVTAFILITISASFSHTYLNGVPPPKFIVAKSIAIQVGNSWVNGYLSLEYQYTYVALSVGYRPANMPFTKTFFDSYSTALTVYGSKYTDETTWYGTFGYASSGFYKENACAPYNPIEAPMLIGLAGYRFNYGNFSTKIGVGWGFSSEGSDMQLEIVGRYIF